MSSKSTLVLVLGAAVLLSGCASPKRQASMGLMAPDTPVLSLGAGDSLGQRVYLNDLIIAARDSAGSEVAVTAVPESMPMGLGE